MIDMRITQERADAYAKLADAPNVRFVTSEKARDEVRRATSQQRSAILQLLVAFIEKVEGRRLEYTTGYGEGAYGAGPYGGSWTDPLFAQLKSIFDADDAEHIAQAVHSHCDFFLTLDERTILDRVRQHRDVVHSLCGAMQFVTPETLVSELQS
jgi:hypothetical protein